MERALQQEENQQHDCEKLLELTEQGNNLTLIPVQLNFFLFSFSEFLRLFVWNCWNLINSKGRKWNDSFWCWPSTPSFDTSKTTPNLSLGDRGTHLNFPYLILESFSGVEASNYFGSDLRRMLVIFLKIYAGKWHVFLGISFLEFFLEFQVQVGIWPPTTIWRTHTHVFALSHTHFWHSSGICLDFAEINFSLNQRGPSRVWW